MLRNWIQFGFEDLPVADTLVTSPELDLAEIRAQEARLAEALRQGAEWAYEDLVERYQLPVYNLVYRLLNGPADAGDVVQEVFLKVFRNIQSFRSEASLKTWIYRIAVNEAYNHRRWFFRHKRQEVELEGERETSPSYRETLPDAARSPYELALDREKRALIESALERINPDFRAAVVLRDVEGMSYEEVSDVLGISMGTVKSRILRGREALRQELAGRLEPQPRLGWTTA
jgi:RNA polymerase sigma-70 factor (ECF subfamily)